MASVLVVPPPSLPSKQPPLGGVDNNKFKLQLLLSSNSNSNSSSRNNRPNSSNSSRVSEEENELSSSLSWYGEGRGFPRRQMVLHLLTASLLATPFPSFAFPAPNDFRTYSDESNKFSIIIPTDWEVGSGENNGVTSLTAFYPAQPSASNVTVVITGLGADYTRLESFGKVDAFAENLVSGLDRSWQRPPGVAAKLIDSKAANGLYYIEYTLQKPGESRRHLYSVLGMANNGTYNRLYTVTGQFVDEDSEKYGSQIEKAVASFRLI